ncbi:MAG: cell wall hydrolase/autolysin, partial [Bacteroidetes bacterium]|nr:cell wall hydrolase/autolysin [Bacteroidota bacterium]
GEKLSSIARKYGVTVADLKTWNYIGKKGVRPGKKLTVYVRVQKTETKAIDIKADSSEKNLAANKPKAKENKQLAENTSSESADYVYHKVRKGETIYAIAKRYGVTSKTIRALNNLDDNALKMGQKLKIKEKG